MVPQQIQLLLIEDSASDARQICAMLSYAKFAKFNVVRAVTAAEGVACLKKGEYDIILMDLALPDSEDLDAFFDVHTLASKTPVVIACGLHNEELALKAVQQGAQDYVIKNYLDGDLLARTIRNAIERKRTQDALQDQTTILQSILNSIADGVIVANDEGEWILINPAARRIFGYEPEKFPQQSWADQHELFLPDGLTPYPAEDLPLMRARRGETVKEQEVFIRHSQIPEGVIVSVNATPLVDENQQVIGGVAVFRDVTMRRLAEEQIRQLRAVLE